MMLQRSLVWTLGLVMLIPSLGAAQFSLLPGTSATGTEKVHLKPEKIRLMMIIKAQASDAKAAVLAFGEHKERVQKELAAMKADQDSISFGPTQVVTGNGDSNGGARMMQIQMMRSAASGGGGPSPKPPQFYTASCALKAEWLLPVKEGDALAVLPATLRDQVAARDLAGDKNKPKLSKAEQEQWEEMQTMMQENYGMSGDEENSAKIVFVAKLSDEVKLKATRAAFQKAEKEAESLSAGAGIGLGKLLALTSNRAESVPTAFYSANYNNPLLNQLTQFEDDADSVTSASPDELAYTVSVSVTHALP